MDSKVLIATGFVLAFLAGTMASGWTGKALDKPAELTVNSPALAPAPQIVTPAVRYVQPQTVVPAVAVAAPQRQAVESRNNRSWEREVLIVGGSAGAGAAIGAAAGGKKGAAVGAISGGVAGLIYDLATRNK